MAGNGKFQLTKPQKAFLDAFAHSSFSKRFYWTGGTALAYFYLRHRLSHDLDFFSDSAFGYREVAPLVKAFSEEAGLKNIKERKIFDRWDFLLKNRETFRLEFVHYGFKPLKPRKTWQGISVDSLEDMAANKTMAMIDRKEPKDAFDVYHLMRKKKFSPERLLRIVEEKFKSRFSLSLFWGEALKSARELSALTPLLLGGKKAQKHQIRRITEYFEKNAADFLKQKFE